MHTKSNRGDPTHDTTSNEQQQPTPPPPSPPPPTDWLEIHHQDLTTWLDCIKTLLCEDCSSSTSAHAACSNCANSNRIPTMATAAFKSCMSSSSHLLRDLMQNLSHLRLKRAVLQYSIFVGLQDGWIGFASKTYSSGRMYCWNRAI